MSPSFHACDAARPPDGTPASRGRDTGSPGCSPEYPRDVIEDIKKRALHRTSILEGQMRGVARMIENEEYCMDIITQSRAIQRSLESLNRLLLENHLRTHVTDMFEAGGEERDKAVVELLKAFDFDRK